MFQAGAKTKLPNMMTKGQAKNETAKGQPKYYKLVLRSRDADTKTNNALNNGTPNLCRFNIVNAPEGLSGNAVLVVDSFVAQNTSAELDGGYTVSIKELLQPKTYGSDHKGPTDIILTGRGGVYQAQSVDATSCGIPITNRTFFRNCTLTVQIDTIQSSFPAFSVVGDWCLTMWLIDFGEGANDLSAI